MMISTPQPASTEQASTLPFLPLFIDLQGLPCLVIGAGAVAARKAKALLDAGAILTVVAPVNSIAMQELMQRFTITLHQRLYEATDLVNCRLVIAATDNPAINAQIAADAKLQGLLVNVVEPGHLSNAVIPAVINRLPLQVAIFSGGATPALMRNLQRQLEAFIPARLGLLVSLAGSMRKLIKHSMPDMAQRRQFWRAFVSGAISEQSLAGDVLGARTLAEQALTTSEGKACIDVIAVGPGDPELLTLRALRLLQQPDVVIHDKALNPEILARIPPEVERIPVCVPPGESLLKLSIVHDLLLNLAMQRQHVACLHGSHPDTVATEQQLVDMLINANIHYRIVPGVHHHPATQD
jgi:uroporphyrin-III C-methyltransferase/precorrin-2 dehydrogenase/sirohydrochlorin ferrochelatase